MTGGPECGRCGGPASKTDTGGFFCMSCLSWTEAPADWKDRTPPDDAKPSDYLGAGGPWADAKTPSRCYDAFKHFPRHDKKTR